MKKRPHDSHSRRRIVLTGTTTGIGRALVNQFASGGHTVWGCGRSRDHLAALTKQFPMPHRFTEVDITKPEAVDHWAAQLLIEETPPDLVINNAGIINRSAPLWEISAHEFSEVVQTNLEGSASVMRAFLPSMIKAGTGIIVNMSSGWGRSTSPEVAPYCASKWAIEGLSQAVAQEVPPGLAVVAVNPGVIRTQMLESCFGAAAAAYPEPETWAQRAAPFLLGLSAADNGTSLSVA